MIFKIENCNGKMNVVKFNVVLQMKHSICDWLVYLNVVCSTVSAGETHIAAATATVVVVALYTVHEVSWCVCVCVCLCALSVCLVCTLSQSVFEGINDV